MEEQRGLVQESFGGRHPLDDDGLSDPLDPALFFRRQLPARVHDDRQVSKARIFLDLIQHLEPGHVRKAQVEHHAVKLLGPQGREGFRPGRNGGRMDLTVPDQFHDAVALGLVVIHHEELPIAARGKTVHPGERLFQRLLGHRFLHVGEGAPLQALLPLLLHRDDVDGNVSRLWVMPQPVEHRPPVHLC